MWRQVTRTPSSVRPLPSPVKAQRAILGVTYNKSPRVGARWQQMGPLVSSLALIPVCEEGRLQRGNSEGHRAKLASRESGSIGSDEPEASSVRVGLVLFGKIPSISDSQKLLQS